MRDSSMYDTTGPAFAAHRFSSRRRFAASRLRRRGDVSKTPIDAPVLPVLELLLTRAESNPRVGFGFGLRQHAGRSAPAQRHSCSSPASLSASLRCAWSRT
jgi:hypothetical protein